MRGLMFLGMRGSKGIVFPVFWITASALPPRNDGGEILYPLKPFATR